MSDDLRIDTSALAEDPLTELAHQRYLQSPFRTSLEDDWDTFTLAERHPWYESAARQWLSAERPVTGRRRSTTLGAMSEPLDWTAIRNEPLGSRPAPIGDQATAYPPPVGTPNPRARKKRIGLIVGLVSAAVVVLVGLGLVGYAVIGNNSLPGLPATFTVHGSLTITNSASCTSIFTDIQTGAQVVITDEKNTTLGVGQLATVNACRWTFTVNKVPAGKSFYGVTIGRHGTVQFTEAQLRQGADLTLD